MNNRRGPLRVPGKLTMRLPVCVGRGMCLLAVSKVMAFDGTPTSRSVWATERPMASSSPVMPGMSRSAAAGRWRGWRQNRVRHPSWQQS